MINYYLRVTKFITRNEREQFVRETLKISKLVIAPTLKDPVCRDPKDDKYLALSFAIEAKYIITGDNDLLVLNPFNETIIANSASYLKF